MSSAIRDQIDSILRQARLDRDAPTMTVVGMLKNKVLTRLKDGSGAEETDELWLEMIASYAKELKKAITAFEAAGERGAVLLAENQFELAFCEQFLPTKLDAAATEAIVRAIATETGIKDPKQSGRLIGAVMKKHRDEVEAVHVKAAVAKVLAE